MLTLEVALLRFKDLDSRRAFTESFLEAPEKEKYFPVHFCLAWPAISSHQKGKEKKKKKSQDVPDWKPVYITKWFLRVHKTQTSNLQFPGFSGRNNSLEHRGREAPAHPHKISPPCKLAETTQGNVDLGSPRDRPQSTKLKHPSPVKQAW